MLDWKRYNIEMTFKGKASPKLRMWFYYLGWFKVIEKLFLNECIFGGVDGKSN